MIEVDAPDSLGAVSELVESVSTESGPVELDITEPSVEPDQSDVETEVAESVPMSPGTHGSIEF